MTKGQIHNIQEDFESQYTQLRHWEGRIYSDEELARLPSIEHHHPHYREWLTRRESTSKLLNYLNRKPAGLRVLEIGCGNGWLSAQIATDRNREVLGIDINRKELTQGERVFGKLPNLHFRHSTIDELVEDGEKFDIILFAASIQYFESLPSIIRKALAILSARGEVHIVDSHFYSLSALAMARQRSQLYYEAVGFPDLARFYFHHQVDSLDEFDYDILYDPNSLFSRFLRYRNPFHWIRIRN